MFENRTIKGYPNSIGYMGWIDEYGDYMLFSSENDYYDYIYEMERGVYDEH